MNSFEKICKKKCAEVFFEDIKNFSIVCTHCNFEAFKFADFLEHFKSKHFHCNDEEVIVIKNEKDNEDLDCGNNTLYEPTIEILCSAEEFADVYAENIKSENESVENYDRLEFGPDTDDEEDNVPLKLLPGDRILRKRLPKSTKHDCEKTEHPCDDCNKVYKSRKALQRHIRRQHPPISINPEIFPCKSCAKTYFSRSSLTAHERMKHRPTKDGFKPGTYPCPKCDKVYTDRYCLKDHLLRHIGQRNFSCVAPDCTRKFFSKKHLNNHIKTIHIGEKNYVCEICGHSTKTAASLVMHKRTHTKEKPFNCPTCNKAFPSRSAVKEHEVTHNVNQRPHICNVCGKTFARKKALYHHMPLHSGKKFVCKICGKAYSQLAGLSAHKRQHSLNNIGNET